VLLTLGVIVVDRSEARSVARCRTTLLFLSTLKSVRNFVFAFGSAAPDAPRTGVVLQPARFPMSV
jgi:hypothetical protein